MKHMIIIGLFAGALFSTALAEIKTAWVYLSVPAEKGPQVGDISIRVEAGETFRLLNFDWGGGLFLLQVNIDGAPNAFNHSSAARDADPNQPGSMPVDRIFAGPLTVTLRATLSQDQRDIGGQSGLAITYEINRPSTAFQPSNAVVIPADAGGPVEIIMESSIDMVNWTKAESGTYGTTTEKRFFRIRAVRK